MYIEPNTTIILLKDCPLDTTYEHTIYFGTKSAQEKYFKSLAKYTLNEQTYQRVNRGRMRVAYKADSIYDCNYLMFQNTNYGSKWFYAFIKSIEYVNNITAEIEFEIDVMQTWFFDYTLGQCFVEREHVDSDKIGEHTVPEKLETGDYISEEISSTGFLGETYIVIATTFDDNYENVSGGLYAGVYSGLYLHTFQNNAQGAAAANSFINGAVNANKLDGIITVTLMSQHMVSERGSTTPKTRTITKTKFKDLKRADGSAIKNNKLLTYPYNFLYVSNLQGNHADFKYEYFSDKNVCNLKVVGDMSPSPSVQLRPQNYKGVSDNLDEQLTLTNYPVLPYSGDAFKAWIAQGGAANIATSGLAVVGGVVGAALAATPVGVALGTITVLGSILNAVTQVATHETMPNQAKGGTSNTLLAATKQLDFVFMKKHIRPEYVSIIDDFFTMYGYAIHRTKVPNRHVRKNWTYTKTIGCVIHGSVPCDDMDKICSIYNNGITFWANGANVGDYSLDNSII